MVFAFDVVNTMIKDAGENFAKFNRKEPTGLELKQVQRAWQVALNEVGHNSNFTSNHDWAREVNRFGDPALPAESAKLLALFFLQKGTPYNYEGDEIGALNTVFPSIDRYEDPEAVNWYNDVVASGRHSAAEALTIVQQNSRDASRGMIDWIEVARQQQDSNSVLNFRSAVARLRQQEPAFLFGSYSLACPPDRGDTYAWTLTLPASKVLVVMNNSSQPQTYRPPADFAEVRTRELLLHTRRAPADAAATSFQLLPREGRVYRLQP